jgi:hypothetical protein
VASLPLGPLPKINKRGPGHSGEIKKEAHSEAMGTHLYNLYVPYP